MHALKVASPPSLPPTWSPPNFDLEPEEIPGAGDGRPAALMARDAMTEPIVENQVGKQPRPELGIIEWRDRLAIAFGSLRFPMEPEEARDVARELVKMAEYIEAKRKSDPGRRPR
jgi:hypothetical protein